MAPRIVVAGSANMDLVGVATRLPLPGETVLGDDFVMMPGGKGANQAIAAARAGGHAVFLGAIGSDAFGVTLNARIAAAGVDTAHMRTAYGASGVAVIMVDRAGENSILVAPGANNAFTTLSAAEQDVIGDADVLLCQQEIPEETVLAAARAARAGGTRTILNAAPARALSRELLELIDLLVVNEVEAQAITAGPFPSGGPFPGDGPGAESDSGSESVSGGEPVSSGESVSSGEPVSGGGSVSGGLDSATVMGSLLSLVPRVVLTLGGAGARYADRDGRDQLVPAFPVEAADTTAAGDAFTGALAVAWGEGRDLVDAVRWANAAGAACARKLGASNSLPSRSEIDALYNS